MAIKKKTVGTKKATRKGAERKKSTRRKPPAPMTSGLPPERHGSSLPPGATPGREGPTEKVTLEHFLVACQKSLARSAHAAEHASRAESEFAHGDRSLYVIDGFDLDLSAGLSMNFEVDSADPSKLRPHGVVLDFAPPEIERSRLRFRVGTKPLELLEGASLQLANLDPLGDLLPAAHLRAWLVNARGEEVPAHTVELHFMPAGSRDPNLMSSLKLISDMMGRVNFWLRPRGSTLEVEVVGDKIYRRRVLREDIEDYLLWVVCEMPDETDPNRKITLKTEVIRLPAR